MMKKKQKKPFNRKEVNILIALTLLSLWRKTWLTLVEVKKM
jgi:hypothetical protein